MESLTKTQEKVLACLKSHTFERGYPPTIREIKTALGLSGHSSVQYALRALEDKGYIRRSGKARGIEFCRNQKTDQPVQLPVVGTIKAGPPHVAVEDVRGYVAVDRSFVAGAGNFLLKVDGDSMTDAHIQDGDYVVVKPQPVAGNGDIVVAVVDDEATVKKFYKRNSTIRLEPANPGYESVVVEAGRNEVSVVGRVISVLRHIE